MNLMLRTKRLIGPFWSQLILLAAGLLLTVPAASASPVHVIGHECGPAAFAATWEKEISGGPLLSSVTASTAVPGTYIVRGHGFSAGGAVEIVAYDACGVQRHDQWPTVANDFSSPVTDAPDPEALRSLPAGLVVWTFTLDTEDPLTVRAHDLETGEWTNVVLIDAPAVDRAACDRDCLSSRGIGPNP